MSIIRVDVEKQLSKYKRFGNNIPRTFVRFLSKVAKSGRTILRNELLSGQRLNLKPDEKDDIGRYLVGGKVTKNFSITFSSYPLNLFERGRALRNGRKEPGRYILTREFRALMNARMPGISEKALIYTISKETNKV